VSEPPTAKELKSLPEKIYDEWRSLQAIHFSWSPEGLERMINSQTPQRQKERTELLRKLIKEYDNL